MATVQQRVADDTAAQSDARRQLIATLPVTERHMELAGIGTTVLQGGSGAPIILLHGPFGYGAHWLRIIPELTKSHRVIAPDLPGHGSSDAIDADLDVERMLAWLGELIEQTCTSSPVLVGQNTRRGHRRALRLSTPQTDRAAGPDRHVRTHGVRAAARVRRGDAGLPPCTVTADALQSVETVRV